MPIELGPRGTMLLQRWQERLEEHLLAVDAADPRAAAADLHLLDASRWAVGAMQVVDGTHLPMAGIVAPLAGGVGDRDHDPLARALRIFAQLYRVVVALRHLPAIEAEDLRRVGQIGMRLDQDRLSLLAVEVVEAADELAGELEVRDLVLPNGHGIGAIDGDVGGLQDRISEEAIVVEVLVAELLLLLLVGRDPLEPADGRDHPEEQEELGVLLHLALDEEDVLLRVEAGGDPVGEHLPLG